ncbi:L-asparaginase [Anaerovibrio sp. JC8]|uniref:asparaginase n=1 Tax=Anaerovibrio sp. JC8 TaxID=1240085 RepID=UPI000A09B857|nr:asparaginase [Anaerovibrio sp. JC8]ORT99836.1 L-asparaginase [Anaerovibrio sp. JC8]
MKKILLIATGGTIASVQTEKGMMPGLDGEGLIEHVPALREICHIDTLELMKLDSTNIQPEHWVKMARTVEDQYDKYDGFVISHGTDTMAFTSSALYYMLENLNKPVIITGSQLSLTEEGSDAPDNLITAFTAAAKGRPGVYLAFYGRLIQGNTVKKLHTEAFYAFKSINAPEVAELKDGVLKFNPEYDKYLEENPHPSTGDKLRIRDKMDTRVVVVDLVPGYKNEYIRALVDAGCRGMVLNLFGSGGIPGVESPGNLLPAIDYAISKGVKIVGATQCINDGVHMDRYEVGITALKHGVISGGMLTSEAMVARLMLELGEK